MSDRLYLQKHCCLAIMSCIYHSLARYGSEGNKNKPCVSLILFASVPAYLHWLWWAEWTRIFNHRAFTWASHSPQVRTYKPGETNCRGNCCSGYWWREVRATTVAWGRGGWGTRKWWSGMNQYIFLNNSIPSGQSQQGHCTCHQSLNQTYELHTNYVVKDRHLSVFVGFQWSGLTQPSPK